MLQVLVLACILSLTSSSSIFGSTPKWVSLLDRGTQLVKQKNFEAAEGELRAALQEASNAEVKNDTRLGEVYRQLVMAVGQSGDNAGAKQVCDDAMKAGFYKEVSQFRDYSVRMLGYDSTAAIADEAYEASLQHPLPEFARNVEKFMKVNLELAEDHPRVVPQKWQEPFEKIAAKFEHRQGQLWRELRTDFGTYEKPFVVKNALSPSECDAVIKHMSNLPEKPGPLNEKVVIPTLKTNRINQLPEFTGTGSASRGAYPKAIAPILEKVVSLVQEANLLFYGFSHLMFPPQRIEMGTYHAKEAGHYMWHTDVSFEGCGGEEDCKLNFHTTLSFTLLLVDPASYTGGDLVIQGDSFGSLLPRGSLVVFPSYLVHEVRPVRRGSRKVLIGWVQGRSGPTRGPPYWQIAKNSYLHLASERPELCGGHFEAAQHLLFANTSPERSEALLRKMLAQPSCQAPELGWTEANEEQRKAQQQALYRLYCPRGPFNHDRGPYLVPEPAVEDVTEAPPGCAGWQKADEAWMLMGHAVRRQGRLDEAIQYLEAAIRWTPRDRSSADFQKTLGEFRAVREEMARTGDARPLPPRDSVNSFEPEARKANGGKKLGKGSKKSKKSEL